MYKAPIIELKKCDLLLDVLNIAPRETSLGTRLGREQLEQNEKVKEEKKDLPKVERRGKVIETPLIELKYLAVLDVYLAFLVLHCLYEELNHAYHTVLV